MEVKKPLIYVGYTNGAYRSNGFSLTEGRFYQCGCEFPFDNLKYIRSCKGANLGTLLVGLVKILDEWSKKVDLSDFEKEFDNLTKDEENLVTKIIGLYAANQVDL